MKKKKYIYEIKEILEKNNLISSTKLNDNTQIDYLSFNSKDVKNNTLFFCKGDEFTINYLNEAKENGCNIYISEKKYNINIPCIIVKDIQKAMAIISAFYYDYAYQDLTLIGITGTKGKTTTLYLIKNIIECYTKSKCGIISSIEVNTGKKSILSNLTTPESIDLHKYFYEAKNNNIKFMVMEVSSQSEKKDRIYGLTFDYGIFLNITSDHISPNEHPNFADYLECKLRFIKKCKNVICNKNTINYWNVKKCSNNLSTFSKNKTAFADALLINKEIINKELTLTIQYRNRQNKIKTKLIGDFNIDNILAAYLLAKLLKINTTSIKNGIYKTVVAGRMDIYNINKKYVVIDYAHNYISFKNVYKTIKKYFPNKKIVSIFGCPGNKAFNRRKELALLADKYSDYIILTSDDPNYENPKNICFDIASNISNTPHEILINREKAIIKGINIFRSSMVLILGKGTENYQRINGKKISYKKDDEIVKNYIKFLKKSNK